LLADVDRDEKLPLRGGKGSAPRGCPPTAAPCGLLALLLALGPPASWWCLLLLGRDGSDGRLGARLLSSATPAIPAAAPLLRGSRGLGGLGLRLRSLSRLRYLRCRGILHRGFLLLLAEAKP